ncbi:uncharacterized protein LOC100177400 isoform X2 [Ciona intestinalis]
MRFLIFSVLLLLAFTEARRLNANKPARRIPRPANCSNIQSFERGYKYVYDYDAIVENVNDQSNPINGVRLRCGNVVITVPSTCTGVLKISDCNVYEGRLLSNGSLAYDVVSSTSRATEKSLRRNEIYFHFNQGEIGKIFLSNLDPSDVSNIKRGILSAIQFKFTGVGVRSPLRTRTTIDEVSIFGQGPVDRIVTSYREGYGRAIRVERNLTQLKVPQKQWGSFYNIYHEPNVVDWLSDWAMEKSQELFSRGSQSCDYTLERGRHVTEARCIETHPKLLDADCFLQPMYRDLFSAENKPIRIKQNIKQTSDGRMSSTDRVTLSRKFKKLYREDWLVYEEQWDETMKGVLMNFVPAATFRDVIMLPSNRSTGAILTQLTRSVAMMSQEEMTSLWSNVRASCTNDELVTKATDIWVRILTECSTANWCLQEDCDPNPACQDSLAQIISPREIPSWTPSFERGVMNALTYIPNPNVTIVTTALNICRVKATPATVLTLGKVLARHVEICEQQDEERIIQDTVAYLRTHIANRCSIQSGQTAAIKEPMMIAAMKALAAVPEAAMVGVNDLLDCARNPRSSREVALAAMQALKDMPYADQSQLRTNILRILVDNSRIIEVRIAAYLLLVLQHPSHNEVQEIMTIVTSPTEERALKFYIEKHLVSAVKMHETSMSILPYESVETILRVARSRQFIEGTGAIRAAANSNVQEKKYTNKRAIYVPYINQEVNFTLQSHLVFVDNQFIPVFANATILAEVAGNNITVIQTTIDLEKIMSIVKPLFGDNGLLPDQSLSALLQIPIMQLFVTRNNLDVIPESEQSELWKIQDKAWMAYNILAFQNKPPVDISILGIPINVESLMRIPNIRNLNILNLWKLIDVLEQGLVYKGVTFQRVMEGTLAHPTSIGAPHIMVYDMSTYYDLDVNIVVEAKKLLLTGAGRVNLKLKPNIRVSTSSHNRVQLPFAEFSGSGYQYSISHNSSVNGSIVATPSSIVAHFEPLPPTMQLLRFKADQLDVRSGQLVIVTPHQSCSKQCIVGNCEGGSSIYYKTCDGPATDIGLYVQSNAVSHYQVATSWGAMQTMVDGQNVPSRGINIEIASQDSHQQALNSIAKVTTSYIPSVNEIRCELGVNGGSPWMVRGNGFIYRTPEVASQTIEGLLASMNITNPSGQQIATNVLNIRKTEEQTNEFFSYFFHNEATDGSHKYKVQSQLQLPLAGQMTASGMIKLKPDYSGYLANIQVNRGQSQLCSINASGSEVTINSNAGYLTSININDIASQAIPYSGLHLMLRTTNSSMQLLQHELHMEATRRNNREPMYLNTRLDLNTKGPNHPSLFTWRATTTINSAQIQWDMISQNISHVNITQKLLIPKIPIPRSMMSHQGHDDIRVSEYDITLKPYVYQTKAIVNKQATGNTIASLTFNNYNADRSIMGVALHAQKPVYEVTFQHQPNECYRCHSINVNLPLIQLSEHIKSAENFHQYSALVDMHHSLLGLVRVPRRVSDMVKYYLKKNDRVKLGYHGGYNFQDNNFDGQVGYTFADNAFDATTSIQVQDNLKFRAILNTTCSNCVPILPATFKYNLGLSHTPTAQLTEVPASSQNNRFQIDSSFIHESGLVYNMSAGFATAFIGNTLFKLDTNVNAVYSANRGVFLYYYFPKSVYKYSLSGSAVLRDQENYASTSQQEYTVSMKGGIYPDSPQWVGILRTGRIGSSAAAPEFCASGTCRLNSIELVQTTQCSNYTQYYSAKGRVNNFAATNCTTLSGKLISTSSAFNASLRFDGSRNADAWINHFVLVLGHSIPKQDIQLYIEQPQASAYLPAKFSFNATLGATPSIALDTDIASVNLILSYTEGIQAQIETRQIPLQLNCQAEVRSQQGISINIPTCRVAYPSIEPLNIRVRSTFNSLSSNTVQLQVQKSSNNIQVFNMNLQSNEAAYDWVIACGDPSDHSSPCYAHSQLEPTGLRWISRVNIRQWNHTANMLIPLNMDINRLNIITSNSMMTPMFNEPLIFSAEAKFPSGEGLWLDATCNSSSILSNILRMRNGGLKSMLMEGRSIHILPLAATYSWFNTIKKENEDFDVVCQWRFQNKTDMRMVMYHGPNVPTASLHQPNAAPSTYIRGFNVSVTNCYNPYGLALVNQYADRNSKLLKSRGTTTSNIWPFVSVTGVSKLLSSIWPCTSCLGEIEGEMAYDATDPTNKQAMLRVLLSKRNLLSMMYNMGTRATDQASFISGNTEMSFNIDQTRQPHILVATRVEMLSGQRYFLNSRILSENLGYLSADINETFTSTVGQLIQNEATIETQWLSLKNLIAWRNDIIRVVLRTPNTPTPTLGMDVTIRGREIEIHDLVIPTPSMNVNMKRMDIQIVRDDLGQWTGINMHDLTLIITPLEADPIRVTGHAVMQIGGEWDINIRDTTSRIFKIILTAHPGATWEMHTDVLMDLPMLRHEMLGNFLLSDTRYVDNLNLSLVMRNPTSSKMVPVILTDYQAVFNKDTTAQMWRGSYNSSFMMWGAWMIENPMRTKLVISPTPDNTGSTIMMRTWTSDAQYLNTQLTISNQCRGYWNAVKGIRMCIPRSIIMRNAARTPMIATNNVIECTPTHYATDMTTTLNTWNPMTTAWTPLLDMATNIHVTIPTPSTLTTGNWNMTVNLNQPWPTTMSTNTTVTTTTDGRNRIVTSSWRVGRWPTTKIVLSPPRTTSGPQRMTITALDAEILAMDVATSGCVRLPIITEYCLPSTIALTNINTNIPLTRIIRIIPVVDALLPPNAPEIELQLTGSSTTININNAGNTWTISTSSTINCNQLITPLRIETTMIWSPTTWTNTVTMNKWVEAWTITFVPSTMATTMDLSITSPMLINHIRVDSPGILRLNTLVLRVKTIGELGRILPMDIDLEWQKNAPSWMLEVRSFYFDLASLMKMNVSFILDNTMMRSFVHWDISFPIWKQIVEVDLRWRQATNDWICSSAISNLFLWTRINSSISNWAITPISATIGLPDSPKGLDVARDPRRQSWTWTWSDTLLYRCEAVPLTANSMTYQIRCYKAQPRQVKVPTFTTEVANWQMNLAPLTSPSSAVVSIITQVIRFNLTQWKDERGIADLLRSRCHVTDAELAAHVARYVSTEAKTMLERWNMGWKQSYGVPAMQYMWEPSNYEVIMDSAGLLQQVIGQLTGNLIKTGVVTGDNWIALQANVTCARCAMPVANMELKLMLADNPHILVNTSLSTPFMVTYMIWNATMPVKPVHFGLRVLGNPTTSPRAEIDFHLPDTGPVTTIITLHEVNGEVVQCNGRSDNALTTMHETCNKMQGATTGPQVASFDLPLTWPHLIKRTADVIMSTMSTQPKVRMTDGILIKNSDEELSNMVSSVIHIIKSCQGVHNYYVQDGLKEMIISIYGMASSMNQHSYLALVENIMERIQQQAGEQGIRVPVMHIANPIYTADVYLDIGDIESKAFGLVLDITSPRFPMLTGTTRIDMQWNEASQPMVRLTDNKNLWKMSTEINLRTWQIGQSAFGFTDDANDLTVTPVRGNTGWVTGFTARFVDTESTRYECNIDITGNMVVTCNKMVSSTPREVCRFTVPSRWLGLTEQSICAAMIPPLVYTAAYKPEIFKTMIREDLHYTDEHSLDVITTYLTKRCRRVVNNVHPHINNAMHEVLRGTGLPIDEDIAVRALVNMMVSDNVWRALGRGITRSPEQVFVSVLEGITYHVVQPAIQVSKTAWEIGQYVKRLSPAVSRSATNINVSAILNEGYQAAETYYNTMYWLNKGICSPQKVIPVYLDLYDNARISDFIWSYIMNTGAISKSIFSPISQQMITYNGQYFELPQWSEDECAYVFHTDPIYNKFTGYVKGSSSFLAVPGYLVEVTFDQQIFVTDNTGVRTKVQVPFIGGNTIECGVYSNEYGYCETADFKVFMKYLPKRTQINHIVIKNPIYVTGLMGTYNEGYEVQQPLVKPDGSIAANVADFQTSFSLSGSSQCVVSQQRIHDRSHQGPGFQVCQQAFNYPSIQTIARNQPTYYNSFLQACTDGSVTQEDTCLYVNELVDELRFRGIPAKQSPACLKCNRTPTPSLTIPQLHILVSLSQDTQQLDPQRYLRLLVTKVLAKYHAMGVNGASIGLITYGGRGGLYQPMFNTINDNTTCSDQDAIISIIKKLEFNGPQYHASSTVAAVEFAMHNTMQATSGVVKSLVVLAPESREQNIAQVNMNGLIDVINNDMTSLHLWSPLTTELCGELGIESVRRTGGACVDVKQPSARDLASSIMTSQQQKLGSRVSCTCHVANYYTGLIENKCSPSITF